MPNKISHKSKKTISLLLATSLGLTLISCSSEGLSKTNYKITEEGSEVLMLNSPTSNHWFPSELLSWNAEKDPNLKYNKSVIPLADRVDKSKLNTINKTQDKDMKVVAISIMNESTSGNPSRGSTKFSSNTFSYWQYIDKLVYWGGSSGEGLIVPPTPDVIDSAHKNGVPVLGTVFFPMTAHGGKLEWLDEFLTKDKNGNFPMVDKLIEVAKTYGFDGWFINQETEGIDEAPLTEKHASLMQEFIKEFKSKAKDSFEIMWYDSMTKDGEMDWQNGLTEKNEYFLIDGDKKSVADSMFLNFWWTNKELIEKELLKNSDKNASKLGIDPYNLYAGIDTQANGTTTPVRWDLLEKSPGKTFTSLGLYCPSWTYFSSDSVDSFQDKENKYWVNELGNPALATTATGTSWRGISTYAVEKTVVNSLPFNTNFNIGNGYNFFIDGEKVSELDWNNRSMADVMPTYRWVLDQEGNNSLTPSLDFANAYYGGNSIKLYGNLEANKASTIKLYSSDLKLTKSTNFTTTAKSSLESNLDLVLEFEDGTKEVIEADSSVGTEWTTLSYKVSKFAGNTVKSISYKMSSKENADGIMINLGNINISDSKTKFKKADVTKVNVEDTKFEEDDTLAGIKLTWEANNVDDISHYEIYRINDDKSKSFLGATPSTNFFINALQRDEVSDITNIEVVAVNTASERGKAATTSVEWPDNDIPRANFSVSKTLIAPGESVKFESLSSDVTKEVSWSFPGAKTETSTEKAPTVTYDKEGTYTVTLTAKNEKGEDVKTMEKIITVSKNVTGELTNVALNKSTTASSFVNANEAPEFAVDGKTDTKWCATGKAPHSITIDLGDIKTISEIIMSNAEAGGEAENMNTGSFSVETSLDGKTFDTVLTVEENTASVSKHAFKATEAKFVKVNILKPSQGSDSAARIYEIELNGIDGKIK
ncbi:endo-beta-N-acetylglucosaminidase [Clostridium mediterraneense]|uniref:endo-beta-N-acetylglucosaminidase n=1 Tax=Clostridium mediterraneense TaxID=1805472 RepID=UPI00082ACD0C|nr:discoidin domain-containing protein [Clostridium mediterraneense]